MNKSPIVFTRLLAVLLLGAALVLGPWPCAAAGGQDRLVVGLKAFRDGFHGLAVKELRAFLEASPEDPRRSDILFIIARAEMARKRWPEARQALEELVAAGGSRARDARYWLGWVAAQEGRTDQARKELDTYLAEPGGDHRADALYLAGDLAREAGAAGEADRRFSAFLEEAPKDPRRPAVWADLVGARLASGDAAEAQAVARRALGAPEVKADAAAREAVAVKGVEACRKASDPSGEAFFWGSLAGGARKKDLRRRARVEEGDARLRAGDLPGARKALEAALAEGEAGGRARLLLAEVARRQGDPKKALAALDAALKLPTDPAVAPRLLELRRTAFRLALSLGESGEAEAQARELLTQESALTAKEKGLVHATLGAAAARAGDLDRAQKEWAGVPPGTPSYREAALQGSRALLELGRPREALARVAGLLAGEDPDGEVHLIALAAAEAAGEKRKAADLAGYLAEHSPDGRSPADFLYRRAVLLEGVDDGAAAAALASLVERFPGDPRAPAAALRLEQRARIARDWEGVLRWAPAARKGEGAEAAAFMEAEALRSLGRPEEARKLLEPLAAKGGHRAAALAQLGALADEGGKAEEAAGLYRQALDAGLGAEAAQWVQSRLEALRKEPGGEGDQAAGPTPAGPGETGAVPPEKAGR